jgi:hypothetical protein
LENQTAKLSWKQSAALPLGRRLDGPCIMFEQVIKEERLSHCQESNPGHAAHNHYHYRNYVFRVIFVIGLSILFFLTRISLY